MDKEEFESSINNILTKIFGFDIDNYLLKKNRKIIGLRYSTKYKKRTIEHFFFEFNQNMIDFVRFLDLKESNNSFFIAYYSTVERLKKAIIDLNKRNSCFKISFLGNFDVFAVHSSLLRKQIKVIDIIIIHEICHMIVDSKFLSQIKYRPSKIDKVKGNIIMDYFNSNGDSNVHNLKFCKLLAMAIRRYDKNEVKSNLWASVKDCLFSSRDLKKNFINSIK
jgi:hypothetical protein